ncbi:MAG TPA: amino acid adenylation domain-containing protein [Streptosporangiaceae bacterium]
MTSLQTVSGTVAPAEAVPSSSTAGLPVGVWPLGHSQRALWFLDTFQPGSSFYVISMGLRLRGLLDVAALHAAWDDCVARQDALRTRFVSLDGFPYQVFMPGQRMELPLLDVSDLEPAAAEDFVRRRCDLAAGTSFDLAAEYPVRAELVRLADDHHVLVMSVHHIVFDGWSAQVLLADMAAAYNARRAGLAPRFAPPELTMGEYAARQETRFARGTAERAVQAEYWRRLLSGAERLELPADRVRPQVRTFAGATESRDIDPETTAAIRALARTHGTTVFTVLVTMFSLVLAELTGEHDILFGIPLAGRLDDESADLIGYLVNVLPLRVDLDGVRSFSEALSRHRQPVLDLLTHQEFPFAILVDELQPERTGNRNPYFDVCFQYLRSPEAGLTFGDLQLDLFGGTRPSSQFDLSCDVHDHGEFLTFSLEYSTEIFTGKTAGLIHDLIAATLAAAFTDPDGPIRIAGPRTAPLRAASPMPAQWLPGGLRGLVAGWAARCPEAPAVSQGTDLLTYSGLDAAATRLAGVLTDAGVRQGDRVGLMLEPAVDLPVAILAVLQCGAAYVPVDPRFPAARAAAMLKQAAVRILLVHPPTREKAAGLGADLVDITEEVAGPGPALELPAAAVQPASPAYVIFTSGSTGRPKAVIVQQSAALTLAAAVARVYELTSADRVLQMAAAAVDVSVEEFFGAWFAGAYAVMHNPEAEALEAVVVRQRATVLNLPASLWHEWTRDLMTRNDAVPGCVRLVIAGSERVEQARVSDWRSRPGRGVRLLNAYGTTEACVSSLYYDTAHMRRDAACTVNVPIGGPLPHSRAYVLDGAGRPVPPGVAGELYMAGPGVSLGYAGEGAATAERFLPDPYGPEPGGRMYRTGDRVRVLPAGELDFLGRADTQVKIRGSRIDLAEVERVATQVAEVADFAADVRGDERDIPRLIGYLTVAQSQDRSLEQTLVEEWRAVHDESDYHQATPGQGDFNASGWISSYTQQAIPESAMKEWLAATVERILRRPPGRVLEIGCGTGMILLRVASQAERYVGTDIAPGALAYVNGQLPAAGLDDGRVRLAEAAADDFSVVDDEQFDLVIINSVCQYFPDLPYLERVLTGAWQRLRPGGRIFLGDVRDVTTLEAFHLSVLRARAGGRDDLAGIAGEVAQKVDAENELCVAPGWFGEFAGRLPGTVAIPEVKRGRADTEMNRFRYDVTLWREAPLAAAARLTTHRGPVTLDAFREMIVGLDGGLMLEEVPDARSYSDVLLARQLAQGTAHGAAFVSAPHPDDFADLAAAHGYTATVSPDGAGLLTVLLVPAETQGVGPAIPRTPPPVATPANQPLQAARNRAAITAVRDHLTSLLPPAMVPSRFVVVDRFPMTISGKVDRRRLPDPGRALGDPGQVAACTDTQRALCGIWADALGLANVGIRDNFFEIGGDSITWLRIMSRCIRAGYPVGARDVFLHQTVEQLALVLDDPARGESAQPREPAERPDSAALTPIQRWFFETFSQGRDHQNQCQWYELSVQCDAEAFAQAVRAVAEHHDVLMSRFAGSAAAGGPGQFNADGWRQIRAKDPAGQPVPVREVDVSLLAGAARETVLRRESDAAQASMSIVDGPLFAVVMFRTADGEPDLIFWCVHHLVVDAVSWQPLTEDLDTAVEALVAGERPVFPARGADPATWASWSQQEADRLPDDELAYWRSTAAAPAFALPVTHPDSSPLATDGHFVVRNVRLPEIPDRAGSAMLAASLAGVQRVLADLTGTDAGTVWLEFHGRPLSADAPDVARAVGWFTALFPFLLTADGIRGRLAAIPHGGVGYGRARYLRAPRPEAQANSAEHLETERLETSANVVVNYLGQVTPGTGNTLRPAAQSEGITGPVGAAEAVMPFAAEINIGLTEDGSLTVTANLGARHFDEAAADVFADRLVASIGARLSTLHELRAEDGFELLPDNVRASEFAAGLRDRPDVAAAYALTPAQRTMLYRHLLDPAGDVNYNDFTIELSGTLDAAVFRAAWRALTERHEVLRTSFEWAKSSEPIQIVHRVAPDMRFLDWTGVAESDIAERLNQIMREGRADPPSLDGAPPFRLTLVRLTSDRHRLIWFDHHILLDGWSSGILVEELISAYARLEAGRPPFDDVPVRYRDYLGWLRQRPSGEVSAYWRTVLSDFAGPTPLPLDTRVSLSVGGATDFHEAEVALGSGSGQALRAVAERRRVTVGSIFYAAWAAFLYGYAAQPLITFGIAQSGRPAALGNVGGMVGMYMSTMPLAVRVDAGQSFADLLGQVSEQGWKLMSVAGAGSLWDVYDWTGIPVSRALFHSVVVVQNFGSTLADMSEMPLRAELAPARTASGFPLTLSVDPENGVLRLVGDKRCLTEGTSQQLLDTFAELLRRVLAEPDPRIGDLPAPMVAAPPDRDTQPTREVDPPRGEGELRVARVWCAVLGIDEVSRTVNLFDAGATSLAAARIHAGLCAEFRRELPITDVFRYPTVASMAAVLASGTPADGGLRTEEWRTRMSRRRDALRTQRTRPGRRGHHDGEDADR